jgi:hypothetical protein
MKSYEATATIAATPEEIWSVLTDGASYTSWDSAVARLEGTIGPGEKVKVYPEVNPKRAFPVKVTTFEPASRMVWTGGMPLGLFKGVRTFTLTPEQDTTTFRMREEYTGPMLPLIWRSMPDLQPSFDRFARGLKERVERRA